MEHPFFHAGMMKKEISPTENPKSYRQEFLKTCIFFLTVMPMVAAGWSTSYPIPAISTSICASR